MITLVIVDCQNDFITGTMSVKNAKTVVDNIKKFINSKKNDIAKIIFTVDWHPYNHCSFKKNGGKWPTHCVQFTPGACIEPKLLKFVQSTNIPYSVSTKGEMEEVEQYGAFSDVDFICDATGSRYYFDSIVEADASTYFVVCGIAGDYCVKETMKNMINEKITPIVYLDGIASIDNGTIIKNFIKNYNLEVI